MKTPRLNHLALAQRLAAEVKAWAEARGSSAREQRRRIRVVFARTVVPAHVRYRAIRIVFGVSMLDLQDARQPVLIERGPRRLRRKKGRLFDAA